MEIWAYRLFYDNIHDFKTAAVLMESKIRRLRIRRDSSKVVRRGHGCTHHDMWVSMKTVSHFNLGTGLELMLKLYLSRHNRPMPREHDLAKLYTALPDHAQEELERIYQDSREAFPDGYELVAYVHTFGHESTPSDPPNRDISNLNGLFKYLDEDVLVSQKRYSWELAEKGRWRHYISDISVLVELINRVMSEIPRE